MSDYLDILDNEPDGISEEELQQMQAAQEQRQADMLTAQQEQEEQQQTSSSPSTGESKTTASKEEPKKEEKKEEEEGGFLEGAADAAMDVGTNLIGMVSKPAETAINLARGKTDKALNNNAIELGVADTAVDAVNLIPGLNLPKIPSFMIKAYKPSETSLQ